MMKQVSLFLKIIKFSLILILTVTGSSDSFSQNYCTQTLKKAQLTYDEGRISEVPGMLEECLKNGFNKEEKNQAYRLLTLTYLYLDESLKADQAILKLLQHNHEYKINPSVDPSEFINLYNTFRTNPICRIGIKGGLNWMQVNLIKKLSSNGDLDDRISIKSNLGFQLGAAVEIPIGKNFEFCPELLFANKALRYDFKVAEKELEYMEQISFLSLPVLVKYSIGSGNYIPFINTGLEINFMTSAYGSTNGEIGSSKSNVSYQRVRMGYAAVLGTGVKSKFGPGVISLGFRFLYGLSDHVKNNERYHNNGTYTFNYGNIDSQYKLNTFNINVGYVIPLYKPKKIK